jgi:hypothetical protein
VATVLCFVFVFLCLCLERQGGGRGGRRLGAASRRRRRLGPSRRNGKPPITHAPHAAERLGARHARGSLGRGGGGRGSSSSSSARAAAGGPRPCSCCSSSSSVHVSCARGPLSPPPDRACRRRAGTWLLARVKYSRRDDGGGRSNRVERRRSAFGLGVFARQTRARQVER